MDHTTSVAEPGRIHTRRSARGWVAMYALAMSALAPIPAQAQTAALVTQFLDSGMQMIVKKMMAAMGLGVEGAAIQSGAATQAEIIKAATANKSVLEGLEAYRQQRALEKTALDAIDALGQPPSTCQTVAAQGGIGSASQNVKSSMAGAQRRVLAKLNTNDNTARYIDGTHQAANANLCTPEDAARGICQITSDARYKNLAGADHNAAFLFQSKDGSQSYEGGRDGAQLEATRLYVDRVVAAVPPEQLHSTTYSKSPQGRAYIELLRRYSAVQSMSAYSLNQISQARNPQVGLGTATKMATVPDSHFEPNKADMSMLEAVQRLVATKFSPSTVAGAAAAMSPNLILRDMAQMASFQLWVDHQTLLQDTRTEALMALQMALMTEQTLRPQLDAQRSAATKAAAMARR